MADFVPHSLSPELIACGRIVIGAINGQLRPAFSKLTTLHAKAGFSFAIVTGDLFADDDDAVSDLLADKISIPLPTYFTVGLNPLPQRVVDRLSKDEDVSVAVL
jgi:hypothetical protein